MVNGNLAHKLQEIVEAIDYTYLPEPIKYTSVSLNDVFDNKLRLEQVHLVLMLKLQKKRF